MDGVKIFLIDKWNGIKSYLYYVTIGHAKEEFKTELLTYVDDIHYIFLLIALIGFYFIIAGERKLGSKITSFSFTCYFISRLVMAAYGY